jgi:hypothetical protein
MYRLSQIFLQRFLQFLINCGAIVAFENKNENKFFHLFLYDTRTPNIDNIAI